MKKRFPLSAILKIREYKETVALQEFLKKTKEDRVLAAQQDRLVFEATKVLSDTDAYHNYPLDLDTLQYAYEYFSESMQKQRAIQSRREELKEPLMHAKEEYKKVRSELESVKILHDKHEKESRKLIQKKLLHSLQERIVCQNP